MPGNVYVYNADNGKELWKFNMGSGWRMERYAHRRTDLERDRGGGVAEERRAVCGQARHALSIQSLPAGVPEAAQFLVQPMYRARFGE